MPDDKKFKVEGAASAGPFAMMYGPMIVATGVTHGAKVLYNLLWVLGDNWQEGRHSHALLADLMDTTRRTVIRWLGELEKAGWITIFRDPGHTDRISIVEPVDLFRKEIKEFYVFVREKAKGIRCRPVTKMSHPTEKGVTQVSQGGVTKMSHKTEKGEKEKAPSEARCATDFPEDSGGEPESPLPSGPDGTLEKGSAPASDCGEDEPGNWWADDIEFSDTGKVRKKPRGRNGFQGAGGGFGTSRKTKGQGKRPPPAVWGLWAYFKKAISDKWPRMNIPTHPVGREWGNIKKMLDDYGEADAHTIIDLAVLDWNAIKETWPRVAKGEITTFYAVFTLRADLMAAVASGSGVTTRGNRCSAYATKVNAGKPSRTGWGDLFD